MHPLFFDSYYPVYFALMRVRFPRCVPVSVILVWLRFLACCSLHAWMLRILYNWIDRLDIESIDYVMKVVDDEDDPYLLSGLIGSTRSIRRSCREWNAMWDLAFMVLDIHDQKPWRILPRK